MFSRFGIVLVALAASLATAQPLPSAPPVTTSAFSQQELDQMLAPIALYPDALLSQILMGATYPLEIVQAARWLGDHPGVAGEVAVNLVATEPWDPSVKSLVAFPQVLSVMDQNLDWTQHLGNAFLSQGQQVMDTVQQLRRRAYAAGTLRPSPQLLVDDQAGAIQIAPANPAVVYVPYYNPLVAYGTWWAPAYPPIYWAPWPGYVRAPGVSVGLMWGAAIGVTAGFFFGAFDWRERRVEVVRRPFYYPQRGGPVGPEVWRHDPIHRAGVPYRTEAVRREFGRPPVQSAAAPRFEYRGHTPPAPVSAPFRPLPSQVSPSARPARPSAPPLARAPAREPVPHAFEGINAGSAKTRQFSAQGHASLSRGEPARR